MNVYYNQKKGIMIKVTAIEKELDIKTFTNKYQDISPKTLKIAAEMFLYLYSRPHFTNNTNTRLFRRWFGFYRKLFKTTTPDKIILTLNRMLKQEREESTHGRVDAVWEKTGTLLSLKYEQIQSVLLGTVSLNCDRHETILAKHFNSDNFDYVYCEAQGNRRAKGRLRKSIVDCQLSIVDYRYRFP